ncbi:transcriptional regulator Spx [Gottfriedia solisilvae]|uniref:Regulatory protein Spx n=1 Tax=Gottfriedia solisilvae TaxID=1516104 RepID=A0A8J3F2F9_9BACI|nr:transcriptional regulator Spx [Gottfriedia solisilvae]GGI17929.1 regulatory protein Spx [Gottfriedia solisilvae]
MITLYNRKSKSCKKAKRWLEEHKINYIDRNIIVKRLSTEEIKEILRMTDSGTDEIISPRSIIFQNLKIDLNTISLKELIQIIHLNPGLIRTPILLDHKRIQVGFKEEDIRCFIPRELRNLSFQKQLEDLILQKS